MLVTGDYRAADRPALVARIEESMNGGFLWLNLDAVRAAVEAMPTVARAVVRRRWPASIEVQLRGHAIAAYWAGSGESEAEGGESGLLNQSGEQVPPQLIEGAAGMQELPRLAGPHGTEAAVLAWHRMIQNAARPLGLQARGLSMNGRGSLRARLRSGQGGPSERNEWELALGRGGIPAKLRRFQALYREQLAARAGELRRVDLRYRHGAAVAWRGDRASSHAGAPSGNPNQPPLFRAAGGI